MNIAWINASPKKSESASKTLLNDLRGLIGAPHIIKEFAIHNPSLTQPEVEALCQCQAWVLSFPLYVDAIPSHLLACLCQMESLVKSNQPIRIYAIVNSGFFEGKQCHIALEIMKNWCAAAGLIWGMGIGYGGGGALIATKSIPLGKGPKRSLEAALLLMKNTIINSGQADNIYASVSLPKFAYKAAAEIGWGQMMKANGGKYKDLNRRL